LLPTVSAKASRAVRLLPTVSAKASRADHVLGALGRPPRPLYGSTPTKKFGEPNAKKMRRLVRAIDVSGLIVQKRAGRKKN